MRKQGGGNASLCAEAVLEKQPDSALQEGALDDMRSDAAEESPVRMNPRVHEVGKAGEVVTSFPNSASSCGVNFVMRCSPYCLFLTDAKNA